jgi:hypothetical protein
VSNRVTITTATPLDAENVKRACDSHFRSALTMHNTMGRLTSMNVLPIGGRSFGISFTAHEVTITDDDSGRREHFADEFARRFGGKRVGA